MGLYVFNSDLDLEDVFVVVEVLDGFFLDQLVVVQPVF